MFETAAAADDVRKVNTDDDDDDEDLETFSGSFLLHTVNKPNITKRPGVNLLFLS